MARFVPFACLLLSLVAECLSAQRVIEVKPVLDIGGLLDIPANELTRVSSVVRSQEGLYFVANGKPAEVRVYDASGKLLRRLGRTGSGPGEYKSGTIVQPWGGDSILTMSEGTQRWILYQSNGTLVREWPVDEAHPYPLSTQLYDWAFTRTVLGSRGCVIPVVSKLPVPEPWEPREALTDAAGRVWIRTGDPQWQISPTGALVGTLTLPDGYQILQFSGDLVIGRRLDDEGAEHITVVRVTLPAAPAGGAACDPPAALGPAARRMKTDIGNLRIAGEAVRSDGGVYPTAPPKDLVVISEGTDVKVLKADRETWVVLLRDRKSSLHCFASLGPTGVFGWDSGTIACSM